MYKISDVVQISAKNANIFWTSSRYYCRWLQWRVHAAFNIKSFCTTGRESVTHRESTLQLVVWVFDAVIINIVRAFSFCFSVLLSKVVQPPVDFAIIQLPLALCTNIYNMYSYLYMHYLRKHTHTHTLYYLHTHTHIITCIHIIFVCVYYCSTHAVIHIVRWLAGGGYGINIYVYASVYIVHGYIYDYSIYINISIRRGNVYIHT